ncbi:O-antigen ligase family protein [Paenibacillus tengchongensis]|uniref:O-antigen ligase family protein n=1 Tax=Paenibacillus tengchongensis TaxID=2608684 RepID=UPI001FE5EDAB|nr:O-antigen ligase family protein [Paenibacillus tengchongensis]
MLDFERPLYIAALLGALLTLLWIVTFYKQFRLAEERDVLALAGLLLPLTYALSLFVAVSHYNAMNLFFIQSTYGAVFIVTLYLLRNKRVDLIIQNAVLTIAYFIVAFGLMNWLGAGKVAGSLVGWFSNTVMNGIYLDAVMTDSNGLRLTSIFQYANTYAAFLMAFLFVALFAVIRSRKWYGIVINSFMLVPILVSLLLTLSRGGLVLLPVVFILLLLMLKPTQQILWIVHLAVSGLASLAVISPITNVGTELSSAFDAGTAAKGWGYLAAASVLTAAISWVIQKFAAPWLTRKLSGWNGRKLAGLWLPLVSLTLVALIAFLLLGTGLKKVLPDNIETRLENINFNQHSVLERFTFYKDALKVTKDYPLLGAGGGGWSALYEKYQNNPYTSRQVHNFFLQYLIEVGIIGFIIFMGFMLYIFYKYIRGYLQRDKDDFANGFFYFIIALSILVHSLLDFNMSYAFMGILVFLGLGGMANAMHSKPLPARWTKNGIRLGYLAVLAVCAVALLIFSTRSITSSNASIKAKRLTAVSNSYEEIAEPLRKALRYRPTHPDSVLLLSALDQQVYKQTQDGQYSQEAYTVLERALKQEPNNKQLLNQLINYYDMLNQPEQSYKVYADNADRFTWDINWYENMISRAFALGNDARINNDTSTQQQYFTENLAHYQHVVEGIDYLATLPEEQLQGRPFNITPLIAVSIGKMKQIEGDTNSAAELIKAGFTDGYADLAQQPEPWSADWYNALLAQALNLGMTTRSQIGDGINDDQEEVSMRYNFNLGLQAYRQVLLDANNDLTALPAPLVLSAGKLQLFSGSADTAVNTFKARLSEDYSDPANRELARWYLATLKRLNSAQDDVVYNKLVSADPNEAAMIEEAAAM